MKILPLPSELENQARKIARWATDNPRIASAYLYGSRVKKTHAMASDLDVAVGLNSPTDALYADWILNYKKWNLELTKTVGLEIDLDLAHPVHAPNVWGFLAEGCVEVFRRKVNPAPAGRR